VPKAWSPDGTRLLVHTTRGGKNRIALTKVAPFPARLVLDDPVAELLRPLWSADGKQVLYEARLPDEHLELRITSVDTGQTRKLFTTDPDYPGSRGLAPAWSPDDALIAFSARVGGNSEIVTIKADGSGLQNLTRHPLLDSAPAFSADGREIFFVRNTYGTTQLYRMDLNGGHQRRVTDAPGYEMMPAVSPDGHCLAFSGDRASNGLDIFLVDPASPRNETVLVARRFADLNPAFSPEGKRVAFIAHSDGNAEIYMMNVDGTGLRRLTHSPAEEREPQFSRDGHRIIFSSNRTGRSALYEIDLNDR
jgi:TolB protein